MHYQINLLWQIPSEYTSLMLRQTLCSLLFSANKKQLNLLISEQDKSGDYFQNVIWVHKLVILVQNAALKQSFSLDLLNARKLISASSKPSTLQMKKLEEHVEVMDKNTGIFAFSDWISIREAAL